MSTARRAAYRMQMVLVIVASSLPFLLPGCYTPQTRAREKANTFRQLTPPDQTLVLQGRVRKGLSQEAVYIAWGTPTEVQPGSPASGPLDRWRYLHTFYGPGGGHFGVRRGWTYLPAEHRYRYDRDDFYETPVYLRPFGQVSTEVPYRQAMFDHGQVVSFEPGAQTESTKDRPDTTNDASNRPPASF